MPTQDDPAPHASEATKSNTIMVKVGAQGTMYTLHKELLAYYSDYFKSALSGRWKELDDGVIPLDDVDAEAFDAFVDWMYEKDLPAYVRTQKDDRAILPILWRAYPLADRLLARTFKVPLFDAIFDVLVVEDSHPLLQTIAFLWTNLCSNDPLLQLLIDTFCLNGGLNYRIEREPARFIKDVPQEALANILLKTIETRGLTEQERKDDKEDEAKLKREDYEI